MEEDDIVQMKDMKTDLACDISYSSMEVQLNDLNANYFENSEENQQ